MMELMAVNTKITSIFLDVFAKQCDFRFFNLAM